MNNKNEKLTLVLGGTRSGKSAYAESLISPHESVLYVATAEQWPGEGNMSARIARHQARRPPHWQTLEAPVALAENIREMMKNRSFDTVMIDCMTLFTSNVMFGLPEEEDLPELEKVLEKEITALLQLVRESSCRWIVVSSETGLGIVGTSPVERNFCDGLGLVNQLLAADAGRTVLLVAGKVLELG